METTQGVNQKVVDREPNRAAPVGVAAKEPCTRFSRLVVDRVRGAIEIQDVRMIQVTARDSPDAERREEFILVKHNMQNLLQLLAISDGEEPPLTGSWSPHTRHISGKVGSVG